MNVVATIIDTQALWQTAVAALGGGLGIVFFFSVAIWGLTMSADLRTGGRTVAATAAGALGIAGLLASIALAATGVVFMLS